MCGNFRLTGKNAIAGSLLIKSWTTFITIHVLVNGICVLHRRSTSIVQLDFIFCGKYAACAVTNVMEMEDVEFE